MTSSPATRGRLSACLAALGLALIAGTSTVAAQPPPIDDTFLPPGGPAAPLEPTTQRQACTAGAASEELDPAAVPQAAQSLRYETAWPFARGRGQVVAVIDTGVAPHPRLPGLIAGGDFVGTGDGTSDCDAHGTLVAGIIAATSSPTDAFSGVAPDARILSIRQSSLKFGQSARADENSYQSENSTGTVTTLAMAVRRAADLGATVINISEVACVPARLALEDRSLGAALRYAVETRDVVVVAAAGNAAAQGMCRQNPGASPRDGGLPDWDAPLTIATPAWYDDLVLSVAAVDARGAPAEFTLNGPWVDIAAPGTGIVSLDPASDSLADALAHQDETGAVQLSRIAGTSYAAPFVAGTAALVRERFPELSAREVVERIVATAHAPAEGWNPTLGHGIVDPVAAVTAGPGALSPAVDKAAYPGKAAQPIDAPRMSGDADGLAATIAVVVAFGLAMATTIALLVTGRRRE
ncbi:type VII secretion-associated serine protease mycosin [Hoyosella sp. G463]|uniref:Type VII secretion-associated serine protease mycosin n=1 Tax=Lolliginicoccus lacisalsi TaxID=2742202 RepID=A0A927JCP8_9ACTN|nr:type VII secretion-associated serine protease mycosin [Lolliginicoccus lacisalsi]MBD8506415.1 type VII secretion-associated serine protease mycosin [Lolliginicoccus lacisalsi]